MTSQKIFWILTYPSWKRHQYQNHDQWWSRMAWGQSVGHHHKCFFFLQYPEKNSIQYIAICCQMVRTVQSQVRIKKCSEILKQCLNVLAYLRYYCILLLLMVMMKKYISPLTTDCSSVPGVVYIYMSLSCNGLSEDMFRGFVLPGVYSLVLNVRFITPPAQTAFNPSIRRRHQLWSDGASFPVLCALLV